MRQVVPLRQVKKNESDTRATRNLTKIPVHIFFLRSHKSVCLQKNAESRRCLVNAHSRVPCHVLYQLIPILYTRARARLHVEIAKYLFSIIMHCSLLHLVASKHLDTVSLIYDRAQTVLVKLH